MNPTDKEVIDSIGNLILKLLKSSEPINQPVAELITASAELGILENPGVLRQWKESSEFQKHQQKKTSSKRYKITRIR